MTTQQISSEVTTLALSTPTLGENGFWTLREQLHAFVRDNFDTLYEGAIRLNCQIESDYYAPRRVQIGNTRLHQHTGLKYADGHKYSDDSAPTEAQLRQTVADLQALCDAAAENIPAPFAISIAPAAAN